MGQPGIRTLDLQEYVLSFRVEARHTVVAEQLGGPISIPLDWEKPRAFREEHAIAQP